ncbi:MAG TPA: phosphotransferase, partial [Chloroflexota bacterium]
QIVHRDYDGTNTLVEDSRVCAILDFEFAAPDLRALDLAVALLQFAPLPPDEVAVLSLSAVAAGYLGRLPLLPAELAAMPRLMVLYRSMSLVNRAGRFRLGLAQEVGVLARVDALLRIYDWLRDRPHDLEMVLNPR